MDRTEVSLRRPWRGILPSVSSDPQDLALELFNQLEVGDRDVLTERDSAQVGQLRDALGLPEQPRTTTPITVPAREAGAAVVLTGDEGRYVVSLGSATELPVQIETRNGVLTVDADDPLARARRSIANIDAIKF